MLAFVVDADSDHRVMVGISLAFLGYEVFQFADGAEAVAAAQSVIPSLVIAEVLTPGSPLGQDGIDVLAAIQHCHRRCRLIAMLQTPEAPSGTLRAAWAHRGVDAALAKPVDQSALSSVILKLREEAARPREIDAPTLVPVFGK
ncbi:MAG TPA: hypothetical protein VM639_12565 [Dongiaceae bacterium]|nr:hypothetical protein [Dongiaceae bacterium]